MVSRLQSVTRPAVVATGVVVALVLALAAVWAPTLALLGLVGVVVLALIVLRLDLAVLAYVAAEPVGNLLPEVGGMSAIRLLGAALVVAWLARLVLDSRPVAVMHRALAAAAALTLVVLAALALHPNGAAGLEVASRYLSYLAVLVVLVDSMRHRVSPTLVAQVFVWSCTVAAVGGLVVFLGQGGRAEGPQEDPNDLAFFLVAAVPFAVVAMKGSRARSLLHGAALVLLLVGTAATFSRGALLGLVAAVAVALFLGIVRPRQVLAGAAATAVAVGAVWASAPALVDRSLGEKQTVAQSNIDSRFTSWRLAAEMTIDHPVLGTGPGGFRTNFDQYEGRTSVDPTHLDVAHQMLLDVSSELGLLGLAAFVALLAFGLAAAWRAADLPRSPVPELERRRLLGAAVVTSFAATLVAAIFLSEQYYLPLWLLVALGTAIDPRWNTTTERTPCASPS